MSIYPYSATYSIYHWSGVPTLVKSWLPEGGKSRMNSHDGLVSREVYHRNPGQILMQLLSNNGMLLLLHENLVSRKMEQQLGSIVYMLGIYLI